jgi:hypothetical protein
LFYDRDKNLPIAVSEWKSQTIGQIKSGDRKNSVCGHHGLVNVVCERKGHVLDGLAEGRDVGLRREEFLAEVADEVEVGDGQEEGLALELEQVPLERRHVLRVLRPVLYLEVAGESALVVHHGNLLLWHVGVKGVMTKQL